jgi:hypothetical protein
MGEGSDRPLTVITGDRKTRERRAGAAVCLTRMSRSPAGAARTTQASRPAWRCAWCWHRAARRWTGWCPELRVGSAPTVSRAAKSRR